MNCRFRLLSRSRKAVAWSRSGAELAAETPPPPPRASRARRQRHPAASSVWLAWSVARHSFPDASTDSSANQTLCNRILARPCGGCCPRLAGGVATLAHRLAYALKAPARALAALARCQPGPGQCTRHLLGQCPDPAATHHVRTSATLPPLPLLVRGPCPHQRPNPRGGPRRHRSVFFTRHPASVGAWCRPVHHERGTLHFPWRQTPTPRRLARRLGPLGIRRKEISGGVVQPGVSTGCPVSRAGYG